MKSIFLLRTPKQFTPRTGLNSLAAMIVLTAASSLTLTGCADFGGITSHAQSRTTTDLGLSSVRAQWPSEQWWASYNDPVLSGLIEQALAQNPNIKLAQARMDRVSAITQAVNAATLPDIGLGASSTRERFTENGLYPPPLGGATYTSNALMVNAKYEFDFWGKNRAALDAAISTEAATAAEVKSARLVIASSVAKSYFSLARAIEQQKILSLTLEQRTQLLQLTQKRLAAGLDTQLELQQSATSIPSIRTELILQQEQIDLARHALAALVGTTPDAVKDVVAHLPTIPSTLLPATIPAELLGRRADIAAARARVTAASRLIDVAKTRFYPNINLSLFAGYTGFGFNQWLTSSSRDYGGGPALSLPLFDGGGLRANLREKNADYDAAVESYNMTLIEAVRDVADQITSLRSLELRQTEQTEIQNRAQHSWELAKQREAAGLVSKISALNAESAVLTQRRAAIDLTAGALELTINLNRALGGGFHDPAPTMAQQSVQQSAHITAQNN